MIFDIGKCFGVCEISTSGMNYYDYMLFWSVIKLLFELNLGSGSAKGYSLASFIFLSDSIFEGMR